MKSKSFYLKRSPADKGKHNKTFDFISLYKSAAENSNAAVNEGGDGIDKENSFIKTQNETPCQVSSASKKKKKGKQEPLDISRINIEGPMLESNLANSTLNQSKLTSTPRTSDKDSQVKSIMKNSSVINEDIDNSQLYYSSKPKKRNKSVSFMLEDNEDVVTKKTKSEESLVKGKKKPQEKFKPVKPTKVDVVQERKQKKKKKQRVEPIIISADTAMETESGGSQERKDSVVYGDGDSSSASNEIKKLEKKNKIKAFKNQKKSEVKAEASNSESNNNEETIDNKNRKVNKKKRKEKPSKSADVEVDEPAAKSRKKEVKPDVIAENLENLSIGDNPYTLTNLLDEMTVADKDRKKKSKRKHKKDKNQNKAEEENVEVKEKEKWTKKWNKAKKGVVSDKVATSVIVENLPLSLICSYKQVLAEHFEKCGVVKKVGFPELYPNESTGFTTTVYFESDGAATEALSEDGAVISGSRVHVKLPLRASQTTLVVRSYAPLSDQWLSTTFSPHGRIRNIRRLVKGKKSIETIFIEFHGPEAVERAIEVTKGVKVAGKKIHVAKFEVRKKKKESSKTETAKGPAESDGEADSESSND